MPTSAETERVKAIWNKHITDNNLSLAEATLLSQQRPKQIAKVVTGLADFDSDTLRFSLRAVRNMYNTNTPPKPKATPTFQPSNDMYHHINSHSKISFKLHQPYKTINSN